MLNLCLLASASFRRRATGPTAAGDLAFGEVELVVLAQPRALQGVELLRVARDEPALLAEVAHRALQLGLRLLDRRLAARPRRPSPCTTSPPSVATCSWPLRCASRSCLASAAVFSSSASVTPARSAIVAVWPRTAARPKSSSFVLLSASRGLLRQPGDLPARVAQPDEEIGRHSQGNDRQARAHHPERLPEATPCVRRLRLRRIQDRIHASSCPLRPKGSANATWSRAQEPQRAPRRRSAPVFR